MTITRSLHPILNNISMTRSLRMRLGNLLNAGNGLEGSLNIFVVRLETSLMVLDYW